MFFRNENVFVFKLIISLISITGLSLEVLSTNMEEREMQSALHHIPSGKCLLPLFSIGTKYSRNECSSFEECIAIEENEIIDSFQHIFINCQEGFALRYVNASVAICINGKWQLSPTACVKLCEPIKSTSLQVFCKYNGESVNCEEPVRAGTVARLSCREGYQQELPEMYFNDTCLSSGNWKYSGVQRCSFACGQFNSEVKIMPSRTYYTYVVWRNIDNTYCCFDSCSLCY
ncbi:uncharacterized protein LOC142322616 isoform X1 [Lycorma delicatula]|uniref:uncharacterized protein LOC142322616 isoform X1 n=1 Tax=Lycorma delicatula TaxID=130591 RepID=UPI003F518515